MNTTTTATGCTCQSFGCDARIARGLVPFCKLTSTPAPRGEFNSYEDALAACKPGETPYRIPHRVGFPRRQFGITKAVR